MINLNLEPIFSLLFIGDVRLVGFIVTLKEFKFADKVLWKWVRVVINMELLQILIRYIIFKSVPSFRRYELSIVYSPVQMCLQHFPSFRIYEPFMLDCWEPVREAIFLGQWTNQWTHNSNHWIGCCPTVVYNSSCQSRILILRIKTKFAIPTSMGPAY